MSTVLPRKRIRLKCDASKETTFKVKDIVTNATPELWRGNDVQFELGIFHNDVLKDVSNIATLSVVIRKDSVSGELLASKTISAGELDNSLNDTTWADGSKQHVLVAFTGEELNIAAGNHWLAIGFVTNDSPGRALTIAVTTLKIAEDGIGTESTAQAVDGTAYTKEVADARFQQRHADGASIQFVNGQHPYLYNSDDSLWYPLVVKTVDGIPALTLGTGVSL